MSSPAWCQSANPDSLPRPATAVDADTPDGRHGRISNVGSDIAAYFTAPLRWDTTDWEWFGGALAAVAAAHHYDSDVRRHFTRKLAPGQTINSSDTTDALPTAAVFLGTWGYAMLSGSSDGKSETWAMFESAALGGVTAYGLKYTLRRTGPDQTDNPNEWFKTSGGTFPSFHSTAAFAVGTVLAESGGDDFRWLRRILGYGLGVATSYQRLKHNAHWLSDTMAGAALGTASAHFTMNRVYGTPSDTGFSLTPVAGGAMLTYRVSMP